jgi:type I restriction enzyme M protein
MSTLCAPQAPLVLVRAVVEAVAAGTPLFWGENDLMLQHVAQASADARLLQLVEGPAGGDLVPTAAGRALTETPRGSTQEAQVLRASIAASPSLAPFAVELLGDEEPSIEVLTARLGREGGLPDATATHRAQVLLGWRRHVLGDPVEQRVPMSLRGTWRRLSVTNYKSIQELHIDLPPFAVVVGANGSGKSNFADALVFAAEVCTSASAAVEKRGGIHGVLRWGSEEPGELRISVSVAGFAGNFGRDCVSHSLSIRTGPHASWWFHHEVVEVVSNGVVEHSIVRNQDDIDLYHEGQRLPPVESNASVMTVASQLRHFGLATVSLRRVLRYRLDPEAMREPVLESEVTRLEETGRNIALAVRSLQEQGKDRELEERLAKVVPGLVELRVEQAARHVVLEFRQAQSGGRVAVFNATEMSDGALRALGILVAAAQMRPHELLIVEEPERSVHLSAAGFLYEVLREVADQGAVLVTTHSADLLDAARDEEILVCEYADGITRVGPLDSIQRQIVKDGLFSLSELMRSEPLRIKLE